MPNLAQEGAPGHGILAGSKDPEHGCFKLADNIESSAKTSDIIEIDPSLTNVPQNPIPAFIGMNGRWPKDESMSILERMRQKRANGRFFGSTLMPDMVNGESMNDMSVSPDTGPCSDRLTPNSSTSASDRQQTSSGGGTRGVSGRNSFETSPAPPSTQQQRNQPSIFDDMPGGGDIPTGLTPGRQYGGPETPKNTSDGGSSVGDFSWDSFAGGSGMTPMSEGVLRTMLQMGPMETMDMGWDNPP